MEEKEEDRMPKKFEKSAEIQPKKQGPKNRVHNRENDGFFSAVAMQVLPPTLSMTYLGGGSGLPKIKI